MIGNAMAAQTRRNRILHILEATVGGTREHILQILLGLDKNLFDLTLICSVERDPAFNRDIERLREAGVRVIVVPMPRPIRPLRDLVALVRITSHLLTNRYDIVHTHSSKAGFLGRLAAWIAGVNRIYHTGHIFYFQWRPNTLSGDFFRLLEWFAARLSTRIIALSPQQRDMLIRCGVARPGQVCVIENGVDVKEWTNLPPKDQCREKIGLPRSALVVGMAARLEPQKGCAHFLRAAKLVLNEMPDVHFLLVGEGSLAPQLDAMAKQITLGANFHLPGHWHDMRCFYSALDLFALTSLWEGMPYVILEAMASDRPVCATDIPGSHEIITNDVTGALVPAEDDSAFARRIIELLRDAKERQDMAARAKQMVEQRFTTQRFLSTLEALYVSDLSER